MIELQVHGGPVCCRRALRACIEAGARPAKPGEFTLRAFLNGRLDLSQAESVMQLVTARTAAAADSALAGLRGGVGEAVRGIRCGSLGLVGWGWLVSVGWVTGRSAAHALCSVRYRWSTISLNKRMRQTPHPHPSPRPPTPTPTPHPHPIITITTNPSPQILKIEREGVIDVLVEVEARLDFEEDLGPLDCDKVKADVAGLQRAIEGALRTARQGALLRNGLQVRWRTWQGS